MVHHVESGSDAEAAGLRTMDLVTSVAGQGVDSLDALEAAVRRAQSAGQPLDLMLLRMTDEDQEALFQYQHRFLEISDLARIGPQARKAQAASSR
jgi:C-terminal processing protease CtpA/Prc